MAAVSVFGQLLVSLQKRSKTLDVYKRHQVHSGTTTIR
jgi:hypothetical protein